MEKIVLGVSYGATIVEYKNLKEFVNMGIDLIEIPIIDNTEKIVNFCINNNLKVALHMPNSFSSNTYIENVEDIDNYVEAISNVLKRYNELTNIEYIIVHFPFVNHLGDGFNYNLKYAINKLDSINKEYRTNIYIENVSINEVFFSDIHYKNIVKNRKIKICYDIGHAHVINNLLKKGEKKDYVKSFFKTLNDNIECIHYYNTTNKECNEYKIGEHYPFIKDKNQEKNGLMNYNEIQKEIMKLPNIKYITMEVRRKEYIKNKKIGDCFLFEGSKI